MNETIEQLKARDGEKHSEPLMFLKEIQAHVTQWQFEGYQEQGVVKANRKFVATHAENYTLRYGVSRFNGPTLYRTDTQVVEVAK